MDLFNSIAVAVSLVLLIGYHLFMFLPNCLWWNESSTHSPIQISRSKKAALKWIDRLNTETDMAHSTLAVQTLRNTIYVGIFVGGNAMRVGITLLKHQYDSSEMEMVRDIILAVFQFSSVLCWVQVIRFGVHLGYFVAVLSFEHLSIIDNPLVKQFYDEDKERKCRYQDAQQMMAGLTICFRFVLMT